jgi:folate-binding protein YgfZ
MKSYLKDRAIIEILGEDRKKFLQGLITNDVNKATDKNLIYSAMLSAQGRFLYDFFIYEISEKLMIDCLASRRDEILQKFNLYKLRSKVEIKKNDEIKVFQDFSTGQFQDPRNIELGFRSYSLQEPISVENTYHQKRIFLKIPESEHDLTYEKSLILEFGFDNLNAIDYQKGCYIGQELTSRTHYLGQIRKKIFHIKINADQAPEKNSEITCEGKPAGLILSSVFFESECHALSLIRISEEENSEELLKNLEFNGHKIVIIK